MKTLHSFPLADSDPLDYLSALHANPYTLFFDSADPSHLDSRFSYIAFGPFETIEATGRKVTVTNWEMQTNLRGDPLRIVQDRLRHWAPDPIHIDRHTQAPPFIGGAAGFIGYDYVRAHESLNIKRPSPFQTPVPDMMFGLYNKIIVYDHKRNKCRLMVLAYNENEARAAHTTFLKMLEQAPDGRANEDSLGSSNNTNACAIKEWEARRSRKDYCQDIQRAVDYIYAGDIFQTNLAQHFTARHDKEFDPYAHYFNLRQCNAAPFSGYMNFGSLQIASSSPEQFLSVNADTRRVQTKPIKGTIARLQDPALDRQQIRKLEQSDKDRAENIMIVDLLRNDIAKACEDFFVQVPKLCEVESFKRVHHLVSTVEGTLRADRDCADLVNGCFPGGSITGAPKLRAMEIIDELEPLARGPYCGSMMMMGFNGYLNSNIMIRTIIHAEGISHFAAGGGITALSNPEEEYQEVLDKAAAIFDSYTYPDSKKPERRRA